LPFIAFALVNPLPRNVLRYAPFSLTHTPPPANLDTQPHRTTITITITVTITTAITITTTITITTRTPLKQVLARKMIAKRKVSDFGGDLDKAALKIQMRFRM
jgi:hypothetical protein